ncbi:MAG: hypothetical protein BWK76_16960 [Desulfobulbaceae bacterium A2]|nr:MAG: hypothetical protein BWK76_16960 [Desulfobulbaceae bacterium A2]
MHLLSDMRFCRLCRLLILLSGLLAPCLASAASTRVIVHPDSNVVSLDSVALQGIFTLRDQQWPDGRPIRLLVLPDQAAAHQQFCREILGVFPHQLRRIWDRRVFSGLAPAPRVVADEETMRRQVATTPGAIGYLLHEISNEGVRVVLFP